MYFNDHNPPHCHGEYEAPKDDLEKDHRVIIRELPDLEKFNTVKLGYHTLCWDKGVDFAPEYLYEQVNMQKKLHKNERLTKRIFLNKMKHQTPNTKHQTPNTKHQTPNDY
jgi:hypothetical protein